MRNQARRNSAAAQKNYQAIHVWFDESKSYIADHRHRALRHHAEGIFMAERVFGHVIVNNEGRQVPVRYIGEQHVREDLGHIPSFQDWVSEIQIKPWMYGQRLRVLEVLE